MWENMRTQNKQAHWVMKLYSTKPYTLFLKMMREDGTHNQQAHSLCSGSSLYGKVLTESWEKMEPCVDKVQVILCRRRASSVFWGAWNEEDASTQVSRHREKTQNGWNKTKPFLCIKIRSGKAFLKSAIFLFYFFFPCFKFLLPTMIMV
jgi:hypothetical protein